MGNALSLYSLFALHVYVDVYLFHIIKQPKQISSRCIRYRLKCSDGRVLRPLKSYHCLIKGVQWTMYMLKRKRNATSIVLIMLYVSHLRPIRI